MSKFKEGDTVSYSYGITYRHGSILDIKLDTNGQYLYLVVGHLSACYGSKAKDIEFVWKKEEELMPDTIKEEIKNEYKFVIGDEIVIRKENDLGFNKRGTITERRVFNNGTTCYVVKFKDMTDKYWYNEYDLELYSEKLRTPMYNVGDKVLYSLSGNALMAGTVKEIKPTENDILYKISYSDNVDAMWVSEENISGLCHHDPVDELKTEDIEKLEPDNVNHPSHYETGKFECIEVMDEALGRDAVRSFCLCNAFKYIYRHKRKNGDEDIKKAQWYINKYLELSDELGKTKEEIEKEIANQAENNPWSPKWNCEAQCNKSDAKTSFKLYSEPDKPCTDGIKFNMNDIVEEDEK